MLFCLPQDKKGEVPMDAGQGTEKRSAVYMPWKTLLTVFQILGDSLPTRIDRSVFRSFSGATQYEVMAGLRFLSFINDAGEPTTVLRDLLKADEAARPAILRGVLEKAYADLLTLDLSNATYQQFEERLGELGVNGSTKKKAARFFISAAEYTGIPLSRYIADRKPGAGQPSQRRRRTNGAVRTLTATTVATSRSVTDAPTQSLKTIELESGGTVTFTGSFNLFDLTAKDRAFINAIVEALQSYPDLPTGWRPS